MPERNRSEQEMRNGVDVNQWLDHLAAHPEIPIDLNLLCHINKLILKNTERDYWAGRVRAEVDWQDPADWSRQRAIVALDNPGLAVADPLTGKLVTQFPPDSEVGPLLNNLIAWLNSAEFDALSPIERAAVFHHEFTRIHPFRDGNGRTARATMTLILRRADFGYELFVLQQVLDENRTAYIQALRQADAGDLTDWVLFLARAIKQAIERTIALKKHKKRR
jgi:Fic family protein